MSARQKKSVFWLCSLLCLVWVNLLFGQTSRPASIRFKKLKAGPYLYLRDVAGFYGMKYSVDGKRVRLHSRYSALYFTQDSRLFRMNGLEVNLSFAIVKDKNEMLLAQTDFQYFIDPILRKNVIPRRRIRHILLDPGHGDKDPGAQRQGVMEKNVNLLLSRRIAAILRKRGYKVSLTRDRDCLLRLEQRTAYAKQLQPDLFLSIHCNAINNASIEGIETYIINPAHTPSSGGNVFAKKAAPGNSFDRENALLGFLLQTHLLNATKAVDRGIKRKQFYVIREVACPAALLELGFLSNDKERKKLLESHYQDKLAVAVCDAVQEYENILRPDK
ncbi:MAG: N-acetylmuramoyl-L-alanine amidase [Lentisphaeria bacterium]